MNESYWVQDTPGLGCQRKPFLHNVRTGTVTRHIGISGLISAPWEQIRGRRYLRTGDANGHLVELCSV